MNIIHVKYCRGNQIEPMGKLAYKNHRIFFEYSASFIESGLQLSPFKLPLKAGVIMCDDTIFDGLFGVFNDSLPDGWGRLLLDRSLLKTGINPNQLTALDRLSYVGHRGMGALMYEPEIKHESLHQFQENLDSVAAECLQFQEYDDDEFVDDLLEINGSSAGARPKMLIKLLAQKNKFELSNNNLNTPHNDWIIKFPSMIDPQDIGSIEYAYHLMAIEAGLNVPEARLFPSKKCSGYFGVKRFDRESSSFLHMHSMSGLLHIDHRIPSLDYETLLKVTFLLTKNIEECEKQFRHAVFNVFAHNRDDHAKNFSFLMNESGHWFISPAYDLTFSTGPAGEHHTTIMRAGKNPTTEHLLKLAESAQLKKEKASEIITQVKEAVCKWQQCAKIANVSQKSTKMIQSALRR